MWKSHNNPTTRCPSCALVREKVVFFFLVVFRCLRYNITFLDIQLLFGELAWDHPLHPACHQTFFWFLWAIIRSTAQPFKKDVLLSCATLWQWICQQASLVLLCSQNLMMEPRWPVWMSDNIVFPKVSRRNLWRWVYLHALPPADVCTLLRQIVACLYYLDLHLFPLPSFPPVTQLGHLWQLFEPQPSALPCEPPHSEVPHLSEGWRFTGDPLRIEIVKVVPPHSLPQDMIRPPPYGNLSMEVFLWDAGEFQVCCSQARKKKWKKTGCWNLLTHQGCHF